MDQLLMRLPVLGQGAGAATGVALASPDDAPGLSNLLSAAFGEPWDERWVTENLYDDASVVATYVIRGENGLDATASARLLPDQFPDAGYVHFVATSPAARGKGLGVTVTRAVLGCFADRGMQQAVLETDDQRLSAISMYLALGFVPEYRSADHLHRWSRVFASLGARARPR